MRQKLHRGRRSVFRKRNPLPRIIGTIVVALAVVAVGFFGAKWISEHPVTTPQNPEEPTVSAPTSTPDATTPTTTPDTPTVPATADTVRGFYLPFTALTGDDLSATLTAAKQAGYNAVLFDLKDADGKMHYRFASADAVKVNNFTEDAFTPEALKDTLSAQRNA